METEIAAMLGSPDHSSRSRALSIVRLRNGAAGAGAALVIRMSDSLAGRPAAAAAAIATRRTPAAVLGA